MTDWVEICELDKVEPERGVAALVDDLPVAIFRIPGETGDRVFAIDHTDPRTQTPTIARGLVGSTNGEPIVISPLLKDRFSLVTGACLNDEGLVLGTYETQVVDGRIYVRSNVTTAKRA